VLQGKAHNDSPCLLMLPSLSFPPLECCFSRGRELVLPSTGRGVAMDLAGGCQSSWDNKQEMVAAHSMLIVAYLCILGAVIFVFFG
jgi:hypothetical protein